MLRLGDRVVDLMRLALRTPDGTFPLSKHQADLIEYLVARPGQVVSQAELLREVRQWVPGIQSRAVYHVVARLRKRLEPDPSNPAYLVTVRGAGFRLDGVHREKKSHPSLASAVPRRRTRFFGRERELELIRLRRTDGERHPW